MVWNKGLAGPSKTGHLSLDRVTHDKESHRSRAGTSVRRLWRLLHYGVDCTLQLEGYNNYLPGVDAGSILLVPWASGVMTQNKTSGRSTAEAHFCGHITRTTCKEYVQSTPC